VLVRSSPRRWPRDCSWTYFGWKGCL